ncbi:hypothetical protein [Thermococcus sp. CX2]|nr:hypothetical protein [Thermococcus sp. CX2]
MGIPNKEIIDSDFIFLAIFFLAIFLTIKTLEMKAEKALKELEKGKSNEE